MKLLGVKIEGFRNIKNNSIEFGDGITSLVSTNSYGKSNLMLAIDFAVDFIKAEKKDKEDMMGSVFGIPFNRYVQNLNFVADFMFEAQIGRKTFIVNYGFEFEWIKNEGGKKIVKEWLAVKEDGKTQKFTKLINRDEKALYKPSVTGRCNVILSVSESELMINKLLSEDNLYYYEILTQLNKIKVHYERHLDASSFYVAFPLMLKEDEEFDLNNIDSIPRVIYKLKNKYPDKYQILESAFLQLFPNITTIDVREIDLGKHHGIDFPSDAPYTVSNKVYSMFVQDSNLNQPLDFRSLSDGAKRVFMMLACTVIADIKGISLIEFEEPENSVHPGLLQSYLTVLSQLANECRIIVASHSPYIIQYLDIRDIYIGKPNEHGLADFSCVEQKKIKQLLRDASSESNSLGSYIFELLSGGEDEVAILMNYLEK